MAEVAGAGGTSGDEGDGDKRQFFSGHNMYVTLFLDSHGAEDYTEIIQFLMRSRIFQSISTTLSISLPNIEDFWRAVEYDSRVEPPVMRATINEQVVQFSADQIRATLQFRSVAEDTGPTE